MKNYLENYGIGEIITMILLRVSLILTAAAAVLGFYGTCAGDSFAWAGGLGIFAGVFMVFICGNTLFREMKLKVSEK